jgi:protein-L-isoaspartate(D-aspartate) O-methyltransferase
MRREHQSSQLKGHFPYIDTHLHRQFIGGSRLRAYYAPRNPTGLGTAVLVGTDSLAALVRLDDKQPFELGALPLGPDGHRLAQRLVEHIQDWDTHGRPGTTGLHVADYPNDTNPADADVVIDKRYNRLALTWAS